jgi:sugar O-acyltransferase (sialic acid O-acetyltransferase NeuD family)
MKPILLVGGGGHVRACIDVIEAEGKFEIQGIVERIDGQQVSVLGYQVIGSDADLARLLSATPAALVTVGQVKSPAARIELYGLLTRLGAEMPKIASPTSYVSKHSSIGEGTIIMHGSIINALASVGRNCIINSQALVEHDARIGDHCHVSTGAKVNGGVKIGSRTFIGSGAILREGVSVGANCVIGAGAVVLHDLPEATRYTGMP